MRVLKPSPWLASLGALLLATGMFARVATADVTTDRDASILVFPKVIADGSRDTLIQISNTRNGVIHAQCYYVNAVGICSESGLSCEGPGTCPAGPTDICVPAWQKTDFAITLTRQQPTIWKVSTGRTQLPGSVPYCVPTASVLQQTCPGIPVAAPPMFVPSRPFIGELKCVQVDGGGAPTGGNALKGEAIIESAGGELSAYNAVGVSGINVDGDGSLRLDNDEYNACPERLEFTTVQTGIADPGLAALPGICVSGEACRVDADCATGPCSALDTGPVSTQLTLVPCAEDFENDADISTQRAPVVQIRVVDEMEVERSFLFTLQCFANLDTANSSPINLTFRNLYTGRAGSVLKTIVFTSGLQAGGVLGVAENFIGNDTFRATDAQNLVVQGFRSPTTTDIITLTATDICVGGDRNGLPCNSDVDCQSAQGPNGTCGQ